VAEGTLNMGMFDYVKCDLPELGLQGQTFQSNDTQEFCQMMIFSISAEGRLIKHDYETELTPEAELEYKDSPKDSILRLFGMIKKKDGSDRFVDQNYDGDLHFGTTTVDYRATFRDGTCIEICKVMQTSEAFREWRSIWKRDHNET